MAQRWDLERVRELFRSRGCVLLANEYVNDSTKLQYIAACGHEHSISLNNFKSGKGSLCAKCRYADNGRKKRIGSQKIRTLFESAGCRVIECAEDTAHKVRYIAQCGHENHMDYNHFKAGGGRVCASCSRSVRYAYDYVREAFEQRDCELLESTYVNCKTPMRYIAQCGHESSIRFDTFLNASGASLRCRACHKHTYHEEPSDRDRTASKVWRKAVYARDRYTCVACGAHGGDLNAHHLAAYDLDPARRFDVDNGVTLCPACHLRFHREYGFGGNTPEQFAQWLQGIPR